MDDAQITLGLDGVWKGFGRAVPTLNELIHVTTLAEVRGVCGLSQREMGELLARAGGQTSTHDKAGLLALARSAIERGVERLHPVAKHTVAQYEHGERNREKKYYPTVRTLNAYAACVVMLVDVATNGTHTAKVSVSFRAGVRVKVTTKCKVCGRGFEIERARDRKCKRCR